MHLKIFRKDRNYKSLRIMIFWDSEKSF